MKKYAFKGEEGIEIVPLQKLTKNSIELIREPHRIGFYQIYHFTEGTQGILEINFEKIPLQANSILFAPSDVVCSFSEQAAYAGEVIIFTDFFVTKHTSFENNLLYSKLFRRFRKPILYTYNKLPIPQLIHAMRAEFDFEQANNRQLILLNYLANIVAYAERLADTYPQRLVDQKAKQQLMARFYDLIHSHYQTEQKLAFYCYQPGGKHAELSQISTNWVGETPKMLINQKILLEAKSLLAYSKLSVKEICFELGLNEPSYFTTFFKRYEGCSPIAFRKKYKE